VALRFVFGYQPIFNSNFQDIWNAALLTSYAAFAYSFVIVLFGAPLSTHLVPTLLLGLNLSILTVLIPAFALGVPSFPIGLPLIFQTRNSNSVLIINNTWVRLFAEHKCVL
jgi:phosphatidylinositol glycan class F